MLNPGFAEVYNKFLNFFLKVDSFLIFFQGILIFFNLILVESLDFLQERRPVHRACRTLSVNSDSGKKKLWYFSKLQS